MEQLINLQLFAAEPNITATEYHGNRRFGSGHFCGLYITNRNKYR